MSTVSILRILKKFLKVASAGLAAGGPVPGPDGGLGNNGGDRGHPFERPRGPGPVQVGYQEQPPQQPVPLSSRAIPGLPPRRRECAKLPGCRHPDDAARRGARAPMPRSGRIGASAPSHLLKQDLLARLRGLYYLLLPRTEVPAPATQARTLVIPSTTSSICVACGDHKNSKTPNLLPVKHIAKLHGRIGEIEPE
jgi:hypothetical protein